MTITELVVLAIGLAVIAVAAALVPALLELRRAARSLDRTLSETAERLPGVLARIDGLLLEAERLTGETRARLDRIEHATTRLKEPVARLFGAAVGLKEAAETLLSGRRRGARS
ncbi:MAG TPA: hypothetical protein VIM86_02125 [Thermodesulfobacteriota bacterium]